MTSQGNAPGDFTLGPPPSPDDPEAQARYFLDMLDAFGQVGSPEAKTVRSALIQAVTAYRDADDKEAARQEIKVKLLGIEQGVAEILHRQVKRIHQQFKQQSRRTGTGSPMGKSLRAAAEGFGLVAEAMETMFEGAKKNDDALRKEAHRKLELAHSALKGLQPGG